jgi:hypothetical protein
MLTGYDLAGIPEELKGLPLVSKPFSPERLVEALAGTLAGTLAGPLAGPFGAATA